MGNESDMHRRKFMEIGIYAISGTIAALSAFVLGRFAVGPSFAKKRAQWVEVELGNKPVEKGNFERVVLEYETKDGWLNKRARSLAYIQRKENDEVIAISASCTHLGCIVTWDENRQIFKCPCHDGKYDPEGKVLSGPPPAPLKRHPVKTEGRKIYVRTDTMAFGGDTREGV
jgi:menaquinol-cytochrome c reductase iron-sulfur subunit